MKEKYVLALDAFIDDLKPSLVSKSGEVTKAVSKAYKVPFNELDDVINHYQYQKGISVTAILVDGNKLIRED